MNYKPGDIQIYKPGDIIRAKYSGNEYIVITLKRVKCIKSVEPMTVMPEYIDTEELNSLLFKKIGELNKRILTILYGG